MADAFLALITPLTGSLANGQPSQPIYLPGYPDQGLPPGSPPTPSQPIYNPAQPDQGLPPGGHPVGPDQGLPPLPQVPPELTQQIIVAVHRPGHGWEVQAYPVAPSHPMAPSS